MHTIEVPDRQLKISIPEHWDEATEQQACKVFEIAINHLAGLISKNEYLTQVLFFLTGMKRSISTKIWERLAPEELVLEKNAKIYQMGESLCMWPLTDEENPKMKYETVKNNLPVIKIGRKKIYGPADLLSDLTFGEFRAAISEMNAHFKLAKDPDTADQSDEALNRFIACLYRPAKRVRNQENSDQGNSDQGNKTRETFNRASLSTKYASKLAIWQKTMILLWFSYCVKYLQSEDIEIDGNIISFSCLFPESSHDTQSLTTEEVTSNGIGWAALLFGISQDGVFGDIEKTDKTGLFDILLYLYNNYLKQQKSNRR